MQIAPDKYLFNLPFCVKKTSSNAIPIHTEHREATRQREPLLEQAQRSPLMIPRRRRPQKNGKNLKQLQAEARNPVAGSMTASVNPRPSSIPFLMGKVCFLEKEPIKVIQPHQLGKKQERDND
jgi:hypothetical protein